MGEAVTLVVVVVLSYLGMIGAWAFGLVSNEGELKENNR